MGEPEGGTEEIDLLKPQGGKEEIETAGTHTEYLGNQSHQNNRGQKVGGKGYGLHGLLEAGKDTVVYTDSHDKGKGKTGNDIIKTQDQGIPQDHPKIRGIKEPPELIEPYPIAAPYPSARGKAFKCHDNPIDGDIVKDNDVYKGNNKKQVEAAGIPDPASQGGPVPGFPGSCAGLSLVHNKSPNSVSARKAGYFAETNYTNIHWTKYFRKTYKILLWFPWKNKITNKKTTRNPLFQRRNTILSIVFRHCSLIWIYMYTYRR
jgi:hypothetical protein